MSDAQQTATETGVMPNIMAVSSEYLKQAEAVNRTLTVAEPEAAFTSRVDSPSAETEIKGRAYFKERIHFFWNKTIDAILDTGWTLVEAQASLSPEEWSKFVKNDVPFDYSILRKLMKTVQSTNISDPKYKDRLPASWTCLHEIALMTPATFQLALKKGFIDRTKFGFKMLRSFRIEHDDPKPKAVKKGEPKAKPVEVGPDLLASAFEDEEEPIVAQAVRVSTAATIAEPKAATETDEAPVTEAKTFSSSLPTSDFAAAKGQITIAIRRELVEKNHEALAVLKRRIEAVVKGFDFVESVVKVEAV